MVTFFERAVIRIPSYVAFGVVWFGIAMAFTFPDEQIKDIVIVQMEKALDYKYDVDIIDLDLWWLTGAELEGITIKERVSPAEANKQPDPDEEGLPEDLPLKVTISRAAARVSLLRSLISLAPVVEFEADVGGGVISGHFEQGSEKRRAFVEFNQIDLAKTHALTGVLGVPFFGTVDGEVDLELHPKKALLTGGTVRLTGDKVTIGEAVVKTEKFPPITYLEVPQTNFGIMSMHLDVESTGDGKMPKLKFTKVAWSGRDIRGDIWGHVLLGKNTAGSRAKLQMRLQLDENFVKSNSLGPLLNVAQVRKGKNKDWFGFSIYGKLKNIQFKGSPSSTKGPTEEVVDDKPGTRKDAAKSKKASPPKAKKPAKEKKTDE